MRFSTGCAALALALFSSPALADRPFSWTGFYVGAHGGWAQSPIDPAGDYPLTGAPTQNVKGGFVGGQIGAQYQWGDWLVTGVEADISLANLETTVRDGNYLTQTGAIKQFGTVRARLGLAMGPFMPYVTGGWAWDRMSQNQICPDPAAVPFGHCRPANGFAPYDLTKTETSTGWVWGGGFDYAITPNWSVRLEAMRLEFDTATFNLGKMANGVENGTKTFEHHIDVVRFAGNFKF